MHISALLCMLSQNKEIMFTWLVCIQADIPRASYLLSIHRESRARQPAMRVCSAGGRKHMRSSQEIQTALYTLLMSEAKALFKFPGEITVSTQMISCLVPNLKSSSHGSTGKRSLTQINTDNTVTVMTAVKTDCNTGGSYIKRKHLK